MKKFEPHYRLVRYGQATKIEKPSRQQRRSTVGLRTGVRRLTRIQASKGRTGTHASSESRARTSRRRRRTRSRLGDDGLLWWRAWTTDGNVLFRGPAFYCPRAHLSSTSVLDAVDACRTCLSNARRLCMATAIATGEREGQKISTSLTMHDTHNVIC